MKKQIFSLTLALALLLAFIPARATSDIRSIIEVDPKLNCIDYDPAWLNPDALRVYAYDLTRTASGTWVRTPPSAEEEIEKGNIYIDLTEERIELGEYIVQSFSIDGGEKWKPAGDALSSARFPRLLNNGLSLRLSDQPVERGGEPDDEARVIEFDKINKRPRLPKLTVNYLIEADQISEALLNQSQIASTNTIHIPGPGRWVLAPRGSGAKRGGVPRFDEIQIAAMTGNRIDDYGFGWFRRCGDDVEEETDSPPEKYQCSRNNVPCTGDYADHILGILVRENTQSDNGKWKIIRSDFHWRLAPQKHETVTTTGTTVTYTPASKSKKITVTSERNPSTVYEIATDRRPPGNEVVSNIKRRAFTQHVKKNTHVIMNGIFMGQSSSYSDEYNANLGLHRLPMDHRRVTVFIPTSPEPTYFVGDIVLWLPATEKRPSTAKQHFRFELEGSSGENVKFIVGEDSDGGSIRWGWKSVTPPSPVLLPPDPVVPSG